ncbi:sigma-54-dependent Fis family transcriptional regulator [Salibacterium lacus]|uniref:PrpR N-terminal domain-containing protein n=1 Tax=Salibacterium lacus TaxID=1898109 RepID=A0ABW5T621_9BACI
MKILAIAPYPGLKELLLSLGQNQPFELVVETGDLNAGLHYAKEAENNGTDIIISRGGTAELIQEQVSIPVIEVEVSGYDMLRVITLIKDFPGKAAIVGFAAIAEGASAVCSLVDIDVKTITITEADEVQSRLEVLQKNGYQVIIGDVITVRIAEELGLNGILLTSGRESVSKAFYEARKSYNIVENMKAWYGIGDIVLRNMQQEVAVLDQKGKVKYAGTDDPAFIQNIVWDYFGKMDYAFQKMESSPSYSFLYERGSRMWFIQSQVIREEGEPLGVFFLSDIDDIQAVRGLDIQSNQHRTTGPSTVLEGRISESVEMNKMYEKALAFAGAGRNILIEGERGTGKGRTAELMHLSSERHRSPFITIDCEQVTENELERISSDPLEGYSLVSLAEGGTVLLKNIDTLSHSGQQMVSRALQVKGNTQIISSASRELEPLVQQSFLGSLYDQAAELKLYIPPLRERKEDIESLSSLFINESNVRYGKQISGIREESLELLREIDWPGNVSQLYRVIEEAVLIAEQSYLEVEDIRQALPQKWEYSNIQVSGTLSEIETRVIKQVLEQEHHNHSRTAKRLGINRTTLWRKLKQDKQES